MASLVKLTVTRWVDPETKARVPAGTPGAKKMKGKTDHYYIVEKGNGRVTRTNTHCTDLRAAQAILTEYHRARERGQAGLTDPYKPHLDRAILEHLTEYVAAVRERVRTTAYPRTVERELARLFSSCGIVTLRDLTPDKVQSHLAKWTVKAATKNRTRSYLFTFCGWLVKRERFPNNPIEKVDTAKAKQDEKERRTRRALKLKELRRLLDAVERYPLAVRKTNRGGRPRQDGSRPDPSTVRLTEASRTDLEQQGWERRLLYRTALLTGLRRGELSRLRVRHLKGKRAVFDLPGELTKNGRAAVIPVVPTLLADLRQWVGDTGRKADDAIFTVPEARNMVRQHQARLRLAGIVYGTEHGFADFHSLRKTTNTYLRRRGVPLRLRQRFLRHAASDLATTLYDDERGQELKPVVAALTDLDTALSRPEEPGQGSCG